MRRCADAEVDYLAGALAIALALLVMISHLMGATRCERSTSDQIRAAVRQAYGRRDSETEERSGLLYVLVEAPTGASAAFASSASQPHRLRYCTNARRLSFCDEGAPCHLHRRAPRLIVAVKVQQPTGTDVLGASSVVFGAIIILATRPRP